MRLIDRLSHTNRLARHSAFEKVFFALGMLGLAVVLPPYPGAIVVAAVVVVSTLVVARIPASAYLRVCLCPLTFLVLGIVPIVVTVAFGGRRLIDLGLSAEGVQLAIRVVLRSLAAMSCLLFLSMSTPVSHILDVMRRLHVPAVMVELSLLVYRSIWVFSDTVYSMRVAQEARLGYGSYRLSYRSMGLLVSSFFGRTLQRARTMEHGLAARNWQGEFRVLDNGTAVSGLNIALVIVLQAAVVAVTMVWWAR